MRELFTQYFDAILKAEGLNLETLIGFSVPYRTCAVDISKDGFRFRYEQL